jgi:hypothetical protein
MKFFIKNSLFIFIFVICIPFVAGQNNFYNPYSRYGIGDMQATNHAMIYALGIDGGSFYDKSIINYLNPATYSLFDSSSIVLNIGAKANGNIVSNAQQSYYQWGGGLNMISGGFRINKFLSAAIGLVPFSNVGYKIVDSVAEFPTSSYQNVYSSHGGINQAFAGIGINVNKNIALGLNVSYLFGSIYQNNYTDFDTTYFLDSRFTNITFVNDIYFNTGLRVMIPMEKSNLSFSFSYAPQININASRTIRSELITFGVNNNASIDTINETIIDGEYLFPSFYGASISWDNKKNIKVFLNSYFSDWKNFKNFGETDSLQNSFAVQTGFSFIPKPNSLKNIFVRSNYIISLKYDKTYLNLRNTSLDAYTVSATMLMPFRPVFKSISSLGINFAYTFQGTKKNNLLTVNNFNIGISLQLKEGFYERKRYE